MKRRVAILMIFLFLFGHFVVFFVSSLLFNFHKLSGEDNKYIWLVSFLEGLGTYFVIAPLFLYTFLLSLGVWLLHVVLAVLSLLGAGYIHHELDEDNDWLVETMKNNVLIFMQILLPFYIFLAVYRDQTIGLQILFSFLSVSTLFFIAWGLRILLAKPIKKLFRDIKDYTRIIVPAWIIIGIVICYFLFFHHFDGSLAIWLNLDRPHSMFDYIFIPLYYHELRGFPLYILFAPISFIPVFISYCFSFTNYRKYLYVIDIKTAFKHEEESGGVEQFAKHLD